MGLQKYHTRNSGKLEVHPNGSVAHYGATMFGRHLAKVDNCPCDKGLAPRTVYVTGEADTFFSLPAAVQFKGARIRGFLTFEDAAGWRFTPDADQQHKL